MGKNRDTPAGQHGHCAKCYSRHCHAPVEISVSCVVVKCRLHCGATFHLCKEEEHQLLCPNAKVPCLNAEYGCPFSMQRHRRARHLEFCPASVVSCSQEWNRWPVADTDTAFYTNALAGPRADGQMDLDLSMALRDQELLFRSIKMKNVFPEMIEAVEEPSDLLDVAAGGVGPLDGDCSSSDQSEVAENGCNGVEIAELSQEERDALAKNQDVDGIVNYRSWEGMFRKEMQGCSQTVKNLEGRKDENASTNGHQVTGESAENQADGARGSDLSRTGLAPWEDGVLERLRREVNVAEYNRYLAQNGAMLINFGQLDACTPRERDFVYGNLEPIEVQTVRTFNVPTSYTAKRCHLKDPSNKPRKVHQSVDTSDLEMALEDFSRRDEVNATLLCSLERELKGHIISERAVTDALYVDQGTQTYDFLSAPFKHDASLADVIADRPKGLHVQIQTESVTRRHNRTSSAFSHICGRVYRRDEYRSHFRNVHADIQSCLNGWFEQRCPLAYLGCTFSQRRFHPAGQQATITYNQELGSFTLRPAPPLALCQHGRTVTAEQQRPGRDLDPLSRLPFEVLQHVAGFLDSFTLCQLSKVSQLMREVCATLLEDRGMVSLKWEKNTCPQGVSSWRCRKKVWEFSDLFSSVDQWRFDDVPSMSEHLKVCPFYRRDEQRSEPVALASMGEVRERAEGQSLVDMFQGKQPPGTRGGGSSSLTG